MRIVHVIRSDGFAGVETHVARLAAAQHDRGDQVVVIGGDPRLMRPAIDRPGVGHRSAHTVLETACELRRLRSSWEPTVVHTHMTAAEAAAAMTLPPRGPALVTTRHFSARRGSSPLGRISAVLIRRRTVGQIAAGEYIASRADGDCQVVHPGLADRPDGPGAGGRGRIVLVVQRLQVEKATDTALRAFASSGLAEGGWTLEIAGDGSERPALEALAAELGIAGSARFLGRRQDVGGLMARAGILLAPAPDEAMGLSVLEAMASALPVVASAAGGHLETVGPTPGAALFPAGDVTSAATLLAALATDPDRRDRYGAALRERQRTEFTVEAQARATDEVYQHALALRRPRPAEASQRDLVVVSLEPWDHVWRRNQHLVAGLLRADPGLRVLFVEPPVDPLHAVRRGARPTRARGLRRGPHLPGVDPDALWLLEPVKALPRRVDPRQDERWAKGVRRAAGRLGMRHPVLWVNDPTGAEILLDTQWPTLYDITDDWLEADRDTLTLARLARHEQLLMQHAHEVVVCSPGLQRTKSRERPVTLLRNAVDAGSLRPAPRPLDLPSGATAVYVGTLHSDRLDVDLCVRTATAIDGTATLVLVGPDALTGDERDRLDAAGVLRLGGKDRREVPGYLQHADVLLVPHVVDDFTESLDPIKLYEYRAVGRPVVSTPVSGFREAAGTPVQIAGPEDFPAAVREAVPATDRFPHGADPDVPTWADRVGEMREVLERVSTSEEAVLHERTLVPLSARVRLGHAAVQHIADQASIDILHIKGDALHPSLVHEGRSTTDVDVLVRPDQVARLLQALEAAGFVRKGRFATSSPFEHSTTLFHELWGHIDVHRLYPGLGLPPDRAFERLWRGRSETTIGGRTCPVPEVPVQALLLILHAARNPPDGQQGRDVEHVWHRADEESRRAIEDVVEELDARIPFATGTGTADALPPSAERDLWQAVAHPDGRVREWRARIAAAPGAGARLRLLARLPLVNTDHLASRLGHRPSRREVAAEFVDRGRRALLEQRRRS